MGKLIDSGHQRVISLLLPRMTSMTWSCWIPVQNIIESNTYQGLKQPSNSTIGKMITQKFIKKRNGMKPWIWIRFTQWLKSLLKPLRCLCIKKKSIHLCLLWGYYNKQTFRRLWFVLLWFDFSENQTINSGASDFFFSLRKISTIWCMSPGAYQQIETVSRMADDPTITSYYKVLRRLRNWRIYSTRRGLELILAEPGLW